MKNINHETIDLLYVIVKLKIVVENYKIFLTCMVFTGVTIGIIFNLLISPIRVDIEYIVPENKNQIAGSNFDSIIQGAALDILLSGKLKIIRNSSGRIDKFVISGDGKNGTEAEIKAKEKAHELFNDSKRKRFLGLIKLFLGTEKNIKFVEQNEKISGEILLLELNKRLSNLLISRKRLLEDKVFVENLNYGSNFQENSVKIKGENNTPERLAYLGLEELRFINRDIVSAKFDIEMMRQKIKEFENSSFNTADIQIFEDFANRLTVDDQPFGKNPISASALDLITQVDKLNTTNSRSLERLIMLKLSLKNYELAQELIGNSIRTVSSGKKYNMQNCILVGVFLSLIFAFLYIYYCNTRNQKHIIKVNF